MPCEGLWTSSQEESTKNYDAPSKTESGRLKEDFQYEGISKVEDTAAIAGLLLRNLNSVSSMRHTNMIKCV